MRREITGLGGGLETAETPNGEREAGRRRKNKRDAAVTRAPETGGAESRSRDGAGGSKREGEKASFDDGALEHGYV